MKNNMEIERKYLVVPCDMVGFLERYAIEYESVPMEQYYLNSSEEGSERYRRIGDRYVHTVKKGGGLVREEYEEDVSYEEYISQMRHSRGGILKKTRYLFRMDGYLFELDSFAGELDGLNMLEVEFDSIEDAENFSPPPLLKRIILSDVTGEGRFTNGAISKTMRLPVTVPDRDILSLETHHGSGTSCSVDIDPFTPISYALAISISSLLDSMQSDLSSILDTESGYDPENLHRFRVASRKIKTLTKRFGEHLDKRWRKWCCENLSTIFSLTGEVRDLDVAISKIERYIGKGDGKRRGIERFVDILEDISALHRREMIENLEKISMGEELREMRKTLLKTVSESSEDGSPPFMVSLAGSMNESFSKVVKRCSSLERKGDDRGYHRLRIEIKKLGYSIEFGRYLLNPDSYEEVSDLLRALQNALGEYHDLQVHTGLFRSSLADLRMDTKVRKEVERLVKRMKSMQKRDRDSFESLFEKLYGYEDSFRILICRA
jgi:CHAD domain-containing protein/CYTH domain-containing protein